MTKQKPFDELNENQKINRINRFLQTFDLDDINPNWKGEVRWVGSVFRATITGAMGDPVELVWGGNGRENLTQCLVLRNDSDSECAEYFNYFSEALAKHYHTVLAKNNIKSIESATVQCLRRRK